jgi:CxxC motif-containing protein (DUF1111 family)
MANVLKDEKKQQIIVGRLGWSLRKIQEATRVRRETISAYLRGAGVEISSLTKAAKFSGCFLASEERVECLAAGLEVSATSACDSLSVRLRFGEEFLSLYGRPWTDFPNGGARMKL